MTDHVTVTGTPNAGLPTGTVNFYVCGPSGANAVCTSTANARRHGDLPASSDTGSVSTGSSSTFTPTQAAPGASRPSSPRPTANYATSADNNRGPPPTTRSASPLGAAHRHHHPRPARTPSPSAPTGRVTDSVTVTGTPNAGLPTGTVKFYVCGPTPPTPCAPRPPSPRARRRCPRQRQTPASSRPGTSSAFTPTRLGTTASRPCSPRTGNYLGSSDNNIDGQAIDSGRVLHVGSPPT